MLTFSFTGSFKVTYNNTKGLLAGTGSSGRNMGVALVDGTGAGQADGIFTADTELAAGSVDAYFLAAGLSDLYGDQVEFTAIKFLMLEADLTNAGPLVIGGGSFPGPFGDPSNTILLGPGDVLNWQTSSANGWPVVDGADEFRIGSDTDALYKLTIVGVSSKLSEPGVALHPEIIGTPRVGSAVSCTAGDFSGNPTLSYQWLVGGQKKTGATGATYTPQAGDLNKPIARVTTLANIAGSVRISTTPILVQAASGGASGGVLDFSDPANSGLSSAL